MRFALLAVALIASSPALALKTDTAADQTSEADQANAAAPAAEPKQERKICKRFNATESRMGSKKVCMTAEEWKRQDRSAL